MESISSEDDHCSKKVHVQHHDNLYFSLVLVQSECFLGNIVFNACLLSLMILVVQGKYGQEICANNLLYLQHAFQ